MKQITASVIVVGILLLTACTAEKPRYEERGKDKIGLDLSGQQKIAVANKATNGTPSNIGKRTAEEMVAAGFKRYGIEKGILIFRLDGALKGTENLYFDHWGWREGKYTQATADVGTYDKKINTAQFLDGERRYEYNIETGIAKFFESGQVQRSADQYGTKDMTIVGDEMIKRMGGVEDGTSKVMGMDCQIWDIDKYKTVLHMWKGITMKERAYPENIPVARTCISLDTTAPPRLEKMVLPANIKPERVD